MHLLQSRVYRILTHYRYPQRSLLREDLRSYSLTLENIWNRRRWLSQASISLSKMTQSLYSGSNWIYYSLPSLVSNTTGCDFGYSFISDPVFDCHLPAFLLPSRYTISVALRPFLIRAKDFLRVAKCYQDLVTPASSYIPTEAVSVRRREHQHWERTPSDVVSWTAPERDTAGIVRQNERMKEFEGGRRPTKGRSGTMEERNRKSIEEWH